MKRDNQIIHINKIHHLDCLEGLRRLPDGCIDCVITSPPYWALRDYGSAVEKIWGGNRHCRHIWGQVNGSKSLNLTTGMNSQCKRPWREQASSIISHGNYCVKCGAWKGQLGLEPDFHLFIRNLCDIFDEIKRVLKETGTCWVNLGDTYSGSWGDRGHRPERTGELGGQRQKKTARFERKGHPSRSVQSKTPVSSKSLCLIPFRFAIEMVNRGWILRNSIIWHKSNCMPSSVKDRFTVDFEYVFFFVKNKKYFFEMQYEQYKDNYSDKKYTGKAIKNYEQGMAQDPSDAKRRILESMRKNIGRNKRTVWTIPAHPFPGAHFATYPERLVATPIKSGCPELICKKCGKARERIITTEYIPRGNPEKSHKQPKAYPSDRLAAARPQGMKYGEASAIRTERGFTDCGCNAGFISGVVLDPFMGSGTTAVVARKLNRNFIGFEMNADYCKIAERRINELERTSKNGKSDNSSEH